MDHASAEEARPSLADIVRINRRFGGHRVVRHLLSRAINGNSSFTLLDVGSASGDTAHVIRDLYPEATVTNLDQNETNLSAAPSPKLLADAFHLPFKADSFDYVFCSLFLHHFQDAEVRDLLAGFYRVARKAVLVSDLERHVLPYIFLPITKPFFGWQNLTVEDGMISVRAAFRAGELRRLSEEAGIRDVEVALHRPAFRISLVGRKS